MSGSKKTIGELYLTRVSDYGMGSSRYDHAIEFIRKTRNHPENIKGFPTGAVDIDTHKAYMEEYKYMYFICTSESDQQLGWIGLVSGDIRLAVDPKFKKQGVATFMLNKMLDLYPNFHAKVKIDNTVSAAFFKKMGFKPKYMILERE